MESSEQPVGACQTEVHLDEQGHARLSLQGKLDLQSTAACWRHLQQRLSDRTITSLELNVSQLQLEGGVGVALLRYLAEGGMTPGARVEIQGLNPQQKAILETFTAEDFRAYRPSKPNHHHFLAEIGSVTRGLFRDLKEQVAFIGSLVKFIPAALVNRRLLRWREIKRVLETAGANALPVVALFSWLVGLVLALESARPLEQFGAQIYIADMVGFSSIRDTGPLVTAIMLAGRSSSAFAAEIGTMKVNQELDALRTMGLNPVQFLVVQRVVATLVLAPILTLYAMLMGIIGGMSVLRFLGFPPLMIYHQIVGRVHLHDLGVGLVKSLIFGLIVGGVGCLRGLQTGEGPRAVGVSTTRSVVASILLIILANSLISAVTYSLSI